MLVSGADNADFQIGPNCQRPAAGDDAHLGVFEFSTFADSGTLNFTVQAYDDATEPEAA